MNKTKDLKQRFNKLIYDCLKKKHKVDLLHLNKKKNLNDDDLKSNSNEIYDFLYMISVTYKRSDNFNSRSLNSHIERINKDFYNLYSRICKILIKGNISRQKFLQPFCFMFVDGAATKFGGYFGAERAAENTHHHGIMLLHPETADHFNDLISDGSINELSDPVNNIASIHIEKLNTRRDLTKVSGYSQKLATSLMSNLQIYSDLYFVLPHARGSQMDKLLGFDKERKFNDK